MKNKEVAELMSWSVEVEVEKFVGVDEVLTRSFTSRCWMRSCVAFRRREMSASRSPDKRSKSIRLEGP